MHAQSKYARRHRSRVGGWALETDTLPFHKFSVKCGSKNFFFADVYCGGQLTIKSTYNSVNTVSMDRAAIPSVETILKLRRPMCNETWNKLHFTM